MATMALLMVTCLFAQKKTLLATMFPKNQTATVTLKDGRKVKASDTNIFLKNAALLYFQGDKVKEARMDIIAAVDYEKRSFINIENRLAYFVDSIKGSSLFCVEIIDMDSFQRGLRNNVNYTFIDLASDHLGTVTNDLNTEDDYIYPVVREFYFQIDGKIVEANQRDLYRVLDKERYRMLKTIISTPDFDWTNEESLMKLLDLITK